MDGQEGDEVVELVTPSVEVDPSWWGNYKLALRRGGISPTSTSVIEADAAYVVDRCILANGGDWSPGYERVRTGLVMGAVQSGKTASMLGVAARSLDAGVSVIVILAGTRIALWRQTYERARAQMFDAGAPAHRLLPSPAAVSDDEANVRLDRLYALNTHKARRLLSSRTPIVMIVMKNVHHIRAAAEFMHQSLFPHLENVDEPVRMLVIDDEADDGSILDALVERGLDPNADSLKQVPRHIAALWGRHGHGAATVDERLLATYVAYTATPQANLLQADHNPLAPRDFVVALRTPAQIGEIEPRGPTYRDSAGLPRWYTGGELFHRTIGRDVLMISAPAVTDGADDHARQLAETSRAVRAYLVAGAIRLWRDGARHPGDAVFATRDEAEAASPRPHSMLFHPSALVVDHFVAAAQILEFGSGLGAADAVRAIHEGQRNLSVGHLAADLQENEAQWKTWLAQYRGTSALVRDHFALADTEANRVPADSEWDEIATLLSSDVLPHVRIAIVNSDPSADDRPRFEPIEVSDQWRAAPDLCTIFVSGNVMARGLTLEGLTTTLFLRSSSDPIADTQQQMQRWFGYRGGYIELCRVFLPEGQRKLFEQYHEADEGLRRQIVSAMNIREGAPRPSVLEGERFRATGKISGITKVPLCPGATPLVRLISEEGGTATNHDVVGRLASGPRTSVVVSRTFRGYLLDEPLSLLETAELLESLRYEGYALDADDALVARWRAVEGQIGDEEASPLFRGPFAAAADAARVQPGSCPYTVAAYLRLWRACLSRHARGLFPTEDGTTPWSALDLAHRSATQPRFWIGIRSGSGESLTGGGFDALDPPLALMRRSVEDGELRAGWGGRSDSQSPASYLGDSRFDHHVHTDSPVPVDFGGTRWRPPGSDGLVLFMPVGVQRKRPVFAVGVAIPLGGPDHFAATKVDAP